MDRNMKELGDGLGATTGELGAATELSSGARHWLCTVALKEDLERIGKKRPGDKSIFDLIREFERGKVGVKKRCARKGCRNWVKIPSGNKILCSSCEKTRINKGSAYPEMDLGDKTEAVKAD